MEEKMRKELIASFALSLAAATAADEPKPVPFPDGYRDWHHVKSMVILPGHTLYDSLGGVHHVYANEKALSGYRAGSFPNGSVLVVDFFKEQQADNTITEGPRKFVAVMLKDGSRYQDTGGWGWEAFKGDSHTDRLVGANAASACFACHAAQKSHDYVFSRPRD
jgi:cytochrome P460